MRSLLLLMFLPIILSSNTGDSISNKQYKIRFSIQAKAVKVNFDYYVSNSYYNQLKSSSSGNHACLDSKINSKWTTNPELKVDFELPYFLKITSGLFHNKLAFITDEYQRDYWNQQYSYAPGSNSASFTITGSSTSISKSEYLKDETEFNFIGTFLGFGFCKQVKRFSFDIDYSLSLNRIYGGYTIRNIYDASHVFIKEESVNIMTHDNKPSNLLFFAHHFNASVFYRISPHTLLKIGYQYSKNDNTINDETHNNYSTFKRVHSQSFLIGLAFSLI